MFPMATYKGTGCLLMLGNCLDRLSEIDNESVDLTVTSPPYDNLRTYNGNNDLWDEDVWKGVLENLYAKTKPGGVVVWVVGDATVNGSETGTSFKQALYAKEIGFNLHDTMIWNKNGFSAVGALKTRYSPVFEYMFVFSKGTPKTFNPIKDRKSKHGGKTISRTKRLPDGTTKKYPSYVATEFGQRFNVWDIQPVKGNKTNHPAPFPVDLVQDHIISWSNEGDVVLDPFMGSGTTGIACKNTGRYFIGIELDEKYFNIAKERILS